MTDEPAFTTDWSTNTSLPDIARHLRYATSVVVLTHAKADGDAVGSTLALTRALLARGIPATPVYTGPFPDRFRAIVADTPALFDEADTPDIFTENLMEDVDAVLICDTGSWSQLHSARAFLETRADKATILDHHRTGDGEIARRRYIDIEAAAACEIAAALAAEILGLGSITDLPVDVATPLYLGIGTDTAWFRHASVTPRTMRTAADLLEAGVDANALVQMSEYADTPERLELIKRAAPSIELFADQRAAMMTITEADFASTGAARSDTSGLVDLPRQVQPVRVSCLLVEQPDGSVKVSLRSKAASPDGPEIDVAALLATLGGGGHKHAAGAKLDQPIEPAQLTIRELVTNAINDAT